MDPSFVLVVVASLGGIAVAATSRVDKLERLGLALFHVVVACVGVASALSWGLGARGYDDGRALVAAAAGPFVALLVRGDDADRGRERLASAWSALLLVGGIASHALLLAGVVDERAPALASGALVVATGLALCGLAWRRQRAALSTLSRTSALADIVASGLLTLAGSAVVVVPPGLVVDGEPVASPWALALAAAAAWATSTRAGRGAPDRRDAAAIVATIALVATVVPRGAIGAAASAIVVGVALGRAVWPASSLRRPRGAPTSSPPEAFARSPAAVSAPPASPEGGVGLGGMSPLLASEQLRASTRPRVLARSPARRILEAAADRAQRSRPPGAGRALLEIVSIEGDADIDGDPGELAEALCAVLDSALLGEGNPHRVSVIVRTSAQSVSFELSEGGETTAAALDAAPFSRPLDDARIDPSLALARARLLVERHGGVLQTRPGPRGRIVQLTVPRRVVRPTAGLA